ncbi:hypothetical protein HNE_3266 [Hyphomonas neptunium ATCC 15444]|uniref:Phage shock protein B n=2 Tax=Hyphomonas TaxID=85 RepID=Q0BX54_HYPNA|nr:MULTISPECIES: hypothetical protein [Hyphomonas]ABI76137.1 hypothetical protein HNE_3266 [Hyphomonas neptunium ATCC 15444]KCZ92061.1 hypothetical protein HHI_12549 [Hyphomonas hirschiana VP5]
MAAAFYFFVGAFVFWLAFRSGRKRGAEQKRPDARDAEFERLTARVRTLEQIITDRDWRLRRDIDGLG